MEEKLEKQSNPDSLVPEISIVMPCYNEEAVVGYTIPKLLEVFESSGHSLELIAVNNGSTDKTEEILKKFSSENKAVRYCHVPQNTGYGNGILQGLPLCRADWVGILPADGQVDAEDLVRLLEAVQASDGMVLGKVRRRFRMDGFYRKVISVFYNIFVRILWPRMQSIDINGLPKIIPRFIVEKMELESRGWLLDPEIMIKAHYMGVPLLEFNVFARMRGNGLSHVRGSTCWEFFWSLIKIKFTRRYSRWKKEDISRLISDKSGMDIPTGAASH